MLRHGKDITRFQRERIIKKRKNSWLTRLLNPNVPDNWFSKHHYTDYTPLKFKDRNLERFDWKRAVVDLDYASLAKEVKKKSWL